MKSAFLGFIAPSSPSGLDPTRPKTPYTTPSRRRPEGWLFVVGLRRWRSHRIRSAIFAPLSLLQRTTEMNGEATELLREMRRLPLRQRQVLAARYLVGLSQDETAAALGIARGTVAAHTTYGLAKLRKRLEVR